MSSKLTERQRAEKDYHDELYNSTREVSIKRCQTGAYQQYWDSIKEVSGLKILDFGCGDGWVSIWLGKQGARVWGVDISGELIKKARALAAKEGLSGSVEFEEMPCEDLTFEDNYFDMVLGSAILHHTDLSRALKSIERVIKPGGKALFIEPMNQSIILKIWRRLTPWRRSPTEKALTYEDIRLVLSIFPRASIRYWSLLSIFTEGALIALPGNRPLMGANKLMERLDGIILKLFPGLGKYSAVVILDIEK